MWSGDTVEWSIPTISRPQLNVRSLQSLLFVETRLLNSTFILLVQAWLVCPDADGNKDVYVNLGPYDYDTPAGCADETIHAYTGPYATA